MNTATTIYEPVITALKGLFGERLKTVVLFGSRARGEATERSDHDLFVVIEGLSTEPIARLREVRSVLLEAPLNVSFIAKNPQEVDANLSPLLLDISVDGICLYGEDYFEPYRAKARKAIEQAGLERKRVDGDLVWEFSTIPLKEWELTWEGYRELG